MAVGSKLFVTTLLSWVSCSFYSISGVNKGRGIMNVTQLLIIICALSFHLSSPPDLPRPGVELNCRVPCLQSTTRGTIKGGSHLVKEATRVPSSGMELLQRATKRPRLMSNRKILLRNYSILSGTAGHLSRRPLIANYRL